MPGNPQSASDKEDQALMARVRRGDRAAFESLFDCHAPSALGLAYRILNERALAEDALQEAFLRIWKLSASFDAARGSFRNWMFTITYRVSIDMLRKQKRGRVENVDDFSGGSLPPQHAEGFEEQWVEDDWLAARRSEVRRALATLPKEQLRVVELAFFKGLTRKQIAEQTGEPLGTIHTRARLALEKLRSELGATGEPEEGT